MKDKIKKFIVEYKKKNGKAPSPKIISSEFVLTKEETLSAISELVNDGFLKKYPRDEEKLSSYHIPARIIDISTKQSLREVENKIEEPQVKGISKKALFVIGIIIRAFMGIVAVAAITVSAYFSLSWTLTFLSPFIAWLLSLTIPTYTSFAIEAGIYIRYTTAVIKDNRMSWPVATMILFLTAGIAMTFEMTMITIGQFNKRSELIFSKEEKINPKNNNEKTLEILKIEEIQILENDDYKYLQRQIQRYQNNFEYGSKDYKNLENEFLKKRNDFKIYETKLEENRKKQKDILGKSETVLTNETKEERKDFYSWFESSFKFMKAGIFEFLTYLMPALFCVVLAPLGTFVAVGLYKRKEQ